MRRGRALVPHPNMRRHGDDYLVSARIIAAILVVSESTVRRTLPPLGRDEASGAWLYSAGEAKKRWAARPELRV